MEQLTVMQRELVQKRPETNDLWISVNTLLEKHREMIEARRLNESKRGNRRSRNDKSTGLGGQTSYNSETRNDSPEMDFAGTFSVLGNSTGHLRKRSVIEPAKSSVLNSFSQVMQVGSYMHPKQR